MTTTNDMTDMTDAEMIRVLAVEGMGAELCEVTADYSFWIVDSVVLGRADARYSGRWNPLTNANDRDMLKRAMMKRGFYVSTYCSFLAAGEHVLVTIEQGCLSEIDEHAEADNENRAFCIAAVKAIQALMQEKEQK